MVRPEAGESSFRDPVHELDFRPLLNPGCFQTFLGSTYLNWMCTSELFPNAEAVPRHRGENPGLHSFIEAPPQEMIGVICFRLF